MSGVCICVSKYGLISTSISITEYLGMSNPKRLQTKSGWY